MSSTALSRRLVKEFAALRDDPVEGITVTPYEDNLRYFKATVQGPPDTPYVHHSYFYCLDLWHSTAAFTNILALPYSIYTQI